jgi:FkbM family methyltransferase
MTPALKGLRARGYAPGVVYDVGASDGGWSRLALDTWSSAKVVCFEPLEERMAALSALRDRHAGRVQIVGAGIADFDGAQDLGVTDFSYDSSFAYAGKSARRVAVRRLDSLLAEGAIPPPDFVKMDVQGYERRVLDGGTRAIASASLLLLECQFLPFCPEMRTLDETVAHLSALGFIPYEFVDFLRRPLDGAMGQCDLLFARKGHALVSDLRWAR